MTNVIAITNQKGGTGKTTTACALVCGLHQRGARVLGVDLDPQGNLGFSLGLDIGGGRTVYDVLKGNCDITRAIVSTEYGDVLPSDLTLSAAESYFTDEDRVFLLRRQLERVSPRYDFIIIDTPSALNLLTVSAFVAAQSLIVPMEAEILSLVGITQLREAVEQVRSSYNPELKVQGILINKYSSWLTLSRESVDMAEMVAKQMGSEVMPVKIRRSVDVAAAPAHGQSVLSYRPKSKPAEDLQAVVSLVAGPKFPLVVDR
jgi:chromosome partitioning protein